MYKMKKREQAKEYMILSGMAIGCLVITYLVSKVIL